MPSGIPSGITTHKFYRKWTSIKERCYNPNCFSYKDYGARGIKMSDEFLNDSTAFCEYLDSLPGWAPGKSLDRPNNDGGYARGNMRWATGREQNLNKRRCGKGYYWIKKQKRWRVAWRINGKKYIYGHFKTEAEAKERARETCPGEYRY